MDCFSISIMLVSLPGPTRLHCFLQPDDTDAQYIHSSMATTAWAVTLYTVATLTEAVQAEAAAAVSVGCTCHIDSDSAQLAACIQHHSIPNATPEGRAKESAKGNAHLCKAVAAPNCAMRP